MLNQQYLTNTYQGEFQSKIELVGTDDKGCFVVLQNTIFYPQGGGQPFDKGTFQIGNQSIVDLFPNSNKAFRILGYEVLPKISRILRF